MYSTREKVGVALFVVAVILFALHYLLSLIDLAGYNVEYIMACNVQKLDERKMRNEAQANETVLSSTSPQSAA